MYLEDPVIENFPGYILGNTSAEYKRLHRQALLWEKITLRVLTEAGLQKGMHCMEPGCGTGNIMRLAGNIVGKSGSVTGFDIDNKIGEEALKVLNGLNDSNYFFEHADLVNTNLTPAKYDFVYCRFFLLHIPNPKTMIKKLYGAIKPGGTLLVQDYDFATFPITGKTAHILGYAKKLMFDIFTMTGKDPEMGTTISRHFIETGMGNPAGTDASSIITPFPVITRMLHDVVENMKPAFLKLGITTEERILQFYDDIDKFNDKEKNFYSAWPMLNSAWIKKPVS